MQWYRSSISHWTIINEYNGQTMTMIQSNNIDTCIESASHRPAIDYCNTVINVQQRTTSLTQYAIIFFTNNVKIKLLRYETETWSDTAVTLQGSD